MNIQPIVEGHGEVGAVPVLLRRFVHDAEAWRVGVGRPIRRSRGQWVQQAQLQQAVGLALRQPGCDAVLIMFDGDDDCPAELGPTVHRWATATAERVPCEVVLPHREYEARFSMAVAHARCRSFRKLTKSVGDLPYAMGHNVDRWPPASWTEDL